MPVKRATVRKNATTSEPRARAASKVGQKPVSKAAAAPETRKRIAANAARPAKKTVARAAVPATAPPRTTTATRSTRASAKAETRRGSCHCGAIEFSYTTARPPARWALNACQCEFCRAHGARLAADPEGEVRFEFMLPEYLRRYRFGLRTADFLVCRACGVFVAAVMITGRGALAAINVNALRDLPDRLPAAKPVAHGVESAEERRARRARSWTPVVGPV